MHSPMNVHPDLYYVQVYRMILIWNNKILVLKQPQRVTQRLTYPNASTNGTEQHCL